MDDSADDDQTRVASGDDIASEDAEGRESGIVEVERKANAVTGGATSAAVSLPTSTNEITGTRESVPKSVSRGSEIEIDTDLEASAPRPQMITQTNETGASSAADKSAAEDDAIPVSDDEIESAEPARPTLTSGLPAFTRSRPPARPSLRPRSSGTSLPPPRSLLGSSLPPPSFPSLYPSVYPSERVPSERERDPWILANKTLELSRANARITALEDQIAFRDARILTLEERLESAQQKIAELEAKLELTPAAARPTPKPAAALSSSALSPSALAKSASPAKSALPAKQVSIPKPSDMAKPPSSRQPLSTATAGVSPAAAAVFATGPAPLTSARAEATPAAAVGVNGREAAKGLPTTQTPKPAEASESVPPPALVQELAASRAPNGPEDLQRIAGIGPRFEAALRKQGITRVSQIAAWSEADIRQAAKALKIPKSRIIKGRWVETARELSK